VEVFANAAAATPMKTEKRGTLLRIKPDSETKR
jgi:hypothetical protein